VTKADFWEAVIIILSDVEYMLADTAGELLNRTSIPIKDKRSNVHIILALSIKLLHIHHEEEKTKPCNENR
jgi:hypothetical protein